MENMLQKSTGVLERDPADLPLARFFLSMLDSGSTWVVTLIASFVIVCACTATLWLGLSHMSIYGHDIFVLLDGSWRVTQGKIPHIDFYSAFGGVFYLLQAAGLKMAHYHIEGIVYGTVLAGLILGFCAVAIFRIRLSALFTVFCTAFLIFFWLAPFPIGEPYYLPSYAMQYNRLGYVVLFIIVVELFGPVREEKRERGWAGFSSGVALSCLLFMKANFFPVGLVMVLGAYALRIKKGSHGVFLLTGFLIGFCAMSTYLHWRLGAFWNDMRIAAEARQTNFNHLKDSLRSPMRNATVIVTFSGLALIAWMRSRSRGRSTPCLGHPLVIALLMLGADFVLSLSNTQRFGFPLTVLAIILFVDQLCRASVQQADRNPLAPALGLVLVTVASVLPFIMDTINAWAIELTMRQNTVMASAARINAEPLRNLVFDDHVDSVWGQAESNGHLFTDQVNDGLALLRQNSGPNDRIACLCFADPFTYSLMRQPTEGGADVLNYGYTFTESHFPSAQRILGDADVVIYSRNQVNDRTVKTLLEICRPILSKKYGLAAESQHWVLLKKLR